MTEEMEGTMDLLLPSQLAPYKIRKRERREASPKSGLDGGWTEYQVVLGRRVMSRWDTREQAQKAIKELKGEL
jgi:hypothetical protein